jgi:ferrous iron transport protein B
VAEETGAPLYLVRRAIIDAEGAAETELAELHGERSAARIGRARKRVQDETGHLPAALEARMRYAFIGRVTRPHIVKKAVGPSWTDRLDGIVTHRLLGTLVFAGLMTFMFVSIFTWAGPVMDLIDAGFGALGDGVTSLFAGTALEGGMLESFLVDGVIGGVGGVLVFLPQIVILFLFIAMLEDCGYLARAAFLMDRLLRFCGLSGHSFIPLLSSFACAIPGVMAARSISDRRDRIATILIAPLMSCSARLPVYAILIAAFVPATLVLGFLPLQGLVFAAMYFLGIAVAVVVALVLKRTLLRGPASTFVMELPPYRIPALKTVGLRVLDRALAFVRRAGTIIVAMAIVVWALAYFPRSDAVQERYDVRREALEASDLSGEALEEGRAEIDRREAGALLRASALGRMGRAIEPVVEPLAWDWKIGMAAIASFPAREVVVSTLSVIYDLGEEGAEEEDGLVASFRSARRADGTPVYGLAVALSIMVFFALCCQCGATVATIRRETNSWGWAGFAFGYMTVLAYVGALMTCQLATALGA